MRGRIWSEKDHGTESEWGKVSPSSFHKESSAEAPEEDLDQGLRKRDLGMRGGAGGRGNVQRARLSRRSWDGSALAVTKSGVGRPAIESLCNGLW